MFWTVIVIPKGNPLVGGIDSCKAAIVCRIDRERFVRLIKHCMLFRGVDVLAASLRKCGLMKWYDLRRPGCLSSDLMMK